VGERFAGRYELVDHLGEGGTGSVWRAWDSRRGQYVAAKLLRQRDAGALLRFVREQSLRVEHPHVVAPTGWAAEDDDVLLTMDLVRGGSVAALVGDYGPLPPQLVAVLLDQLLDALAAVHGAGLVHRDVKPGNLLLEPTGLGPPFLRLADFGIAVLRSDPRLTESGYVVGTVGYVAPEVLRGAEPDPRQDLWQVGTVGLQLLGGPAARAGTGPRARLADWLTTLTRDDPAHRPPDAATARAQLLALGPLSDDDDEPVEVFDHFPPLPPGWTEQGPQAGAGSVRIDKAAPGAGPVVPGAGPALPDGAPTRQVPRAAATRPLVQPATTAAPGSTGAPTPARAGAPAPVPDDPPAGAPEPPEPDPARRLGLGLALRLAAVAVLVVLALLAFSRARSGGATPEPAPGGLPTTTAQVGDACSFLDVGVARASGGRQISCRLEQGRYRWTAD
jgi:serine/threonine-protein kinase